MNVHMTTDQIATLAASGESETLEFKTTIGARREAAMTVCAFLNQRGGQALFGVTPAGVVVGHQVGERTIEELSAELRQIDPPAFPTVDRVPVDGDREVIVVSTSQGISRPYTYRGSAYRLVGNTTLAMSADEYNRMLFERMHSEQRWENQPAAGWSIGDLDMVEIRRTVAEAVRRGRLEEPVSGEPSDLLRGLGLLRDGVLLRAAAVLFGSTERLEFEMPQCLLRVARFRETDRMEFLDNRQFNGNAFTLLANAERFLRDTLPIAGRFEQDRFERIDEPLYPPLATREALANALCHRGLLHWRRLCWHSGLRRPPRGHVLRLPALRPDAGEAVRAARVAAMEPVDRPHLLPSRHYRGVGSGTLKMADLTSSAGLPVPEIEDDSGAVTVRFRHGLFVPQPEGTEVSPAKRREVILALLDSAEDGLARRDVSARLAPHASERQVTRDLEALRERGLIASSGHGASARWKRVRNDG